jgi:hypothetical protein
MIKGAEKMMIKAQKGLNTNATHHPNYTQRKGHSFCFKNWKVVKTFHCNWHNFV